MQARTALKALRGLVKIQALVRGYLVRKQTSEMLRCMNALMSIQVRARIQRMQMAEEPHIVVKRNITHIEPTHDQLRRGDSVSLNLHLLQFQMCFFFCFRNSICYYMYVGTSESWQNSGIMEA